MKTLLSLCTALPVLVAYLVLAALDDLRERRLRRTLGSRYEGPAED